MRAPSHIAKAAAGRVARYRWGAFCEVFAGGRRDDERHWRAVGAAHRGEAQVNRGPRTRLVALLTRFGAPDLAGRAWAVRDLGDLPPEVKGAILDALGYHSAEHRVDHDGNLNQLGRDLDEIVAALGLWD